VAAVTSLSAAKSRATGLLHRPAVVVPATASLCQAATIALTWRLWENRAFPPNIPVVGFLGDLSYALPLFATALASAVWPRRAGPVFLVVLAAAVLGDQTRIQPEVISLALLMVLPAFGDDGIRVSRWHLSALWLWSGLNKALSSGWTLPTGSAAFIATSLHVGGAKPVVAVLLPAAEITLGLTSLWPRAWAVTRIGAVLVHVCILLTLSPLFADWNSAVWPWNVALAVAGFWLFRPGDVPRRPPAKWAAAAGVVLVVSPVLFYAGVSDAYLSHNLYTDNTARGLVCTGPHECSDPLVVTYDALNVPLPPEERLYRAVFDKTCNPDQRLTVTERATVFTDPPQVHHFACPHPQF
jgi:hypothetical protein